MPQTKGSAFFGEEESGKKDIAQAGLRVTPRNERGLTQERNDHSADEVPFLIDRKGHDRLEIEQEARVVVWTDLEFPVLWKGTLIKLATGLASCLARSAAPWVAVGVGPLDVCPNAGEADRSAAIVRTDRLNTVSPCSPTSPDFGPSGNEFSGEVRWVQYDHDHLISRTSVSGLPWRGSRQRRFNPPPGLCSWG